MDDKIELKTDTAGPVTEAKIKLSNYGVTWNTRLEKILKTDAKVVICTFSISNMTFLSRLLKNRTEGITIVANSEYKWLAQKYKNWYPDLEIYTTHLAHAKLVLAEPDIVYLSSENLGHNMDSFDATIGVESTKVYEHYKVQVEKLLSRADTEKLEVTKTESEDETNA